MYKVIRNDHVNFFSSTQPRSLGPILKDNVYYRKEARIQALQSRIRKEEPTTGESPHKWKEGAQQHGKESLHKWKEKSIQVRPVSRTVSDDIGTNQFDVWVAGLHCHITLDWIWFNWIGIQEQRWKEIRHSWMLYINPDMHLHPVEIKLGSFSVQGNVYIWAGWKRNK